LVVGEELEKFRITHGVSMGVSSIGVGKVVVL
jgi:hypothetical protein